MLFHLGNSLLGGHWTPLPAKNLFMLLYDFIYKNSVAGIFNPLSANPTIWSNILKQFVSNRIFIKRMHVNSHNAVGRIFLQLLCQYMETS